jgi:hypothetical protein
MDRSGCGLERAVKLRDKKSVGGKKTEPKRSRLLLNKSRKRMNDLYNKRLKMSS